VLFLRFVEIVASFMPCCVLAKFLSAELRQTDEIRMVSGITKRINIIAIAIPLSRHDQKCCFGNINKYVGLLQKIHLWSLEELIIKPISHKLIIPRTLVQNAQELKRAKSCFVESQNGVPCK
jgi:hypothetical protein